jgi:hypothetical protein
MILKEKSSFAHVFISCSSIMVLFFILLTQQEHIFQEEDAFLRVKIWIFQSSVRIPETL